MSEMFGYKIAEEIEHITLDEWYKRYKPISNPTLEEFENADINKTWTLIQSDDWEEYYIVTGPNRANSFYTFITEIGWELWDEIEVPVTENDSVYYGHV